jgi:hypothetical protein
MRAIPYRYSTLRIAARKKGMGFDITEKDHAEMLSRPCHYCRSPLNETGHGMDRKDTTQGYLIDNVVPCCVVCNRMKNVFLTYEEMLMVVATLKAFRAKNDRLSNRLGVYVASYNNPVFLRHCLLQFLYQSRLPDVLVIHENASEKSYKWAVDDIIPGLMRAGVHVLYIHTPHSMPMPTFFIPPLQALLDLGCDLFIKADVDDIFYEQHLAIQEAMIFNPQLQQPEHDFAMNANSELLVLMNKGGYKHSASVDFGTWNPTGAHPNNIIFNRSIAKEFVREMAIPRGYNDDVILATYVLPKFKGVKVHRAPTSCYVAHNKTASTSHWADVPPPEVG